MLGASPSYMGTLTMCGTVDATVSRQMSEGPAVVRSHAPYPATVIVHLGTNGTVNGADVEAMMQALEGVPTVVLTTVQLNGGRSWQSQANGEIRAAAGRWPNARLADWEVASNGHPEYFSGDGVHLSAAGAQAYADTLGSALAS
jgi:lysophospholipase L1-like esterase